MHLQSSPYRLCRVVDHDRGHPIERVTERSLDEILPLLRAYCEFNRVNPSDDELVAISRALIADPAREGVQFIARDNAGQPAGFATLLWTWATWASGRIGILADLYVAPHARRTGIAQALLNACRDDCRAHGARGLTWSTASDNTAARLLYKQVGASNRDNWVDYWLDT
jgi:GNAT superfamily N-acetyltransferase